MPASERESGSTAGGPTTIEIPIDWLSHFQLPLVDRRTGGPSGKLLTLLQLDDAQVGELTELFRGFPTRFIDDVIRRSTILADQAEALSMRVTAPDEETGRLLADFEAGLARVLGDKLVIVKKWRQSGWYDDEVFHPSDEDRLYTSLTDQQFDVLLRTSRHAGAIEIDIGTERADSWYFRTRRYDSEGRRRGSSGSSGGELTRFSKVFYESLLAHARQSGVQGESMGDGSSGTPRRTAPKVDEGF